MASQIVALTHSDHIKKNENIYIGDTSPKIVLCYNFDTFSLREVCAKQYKLISEIIHNAFDHALNDTTNGTVYLKLKPGNDEITIANTTSRHVTEDSVVYGESKQSNLLDLILDTIHTSSHYNDKHSTAGLFGLGLKVVVSLVSKVQITIDDTYKRHTKTYQNSELIENNLTESSSKRPIFEVKLTSTIDHDAVIGIVVEQAVTASMARKRNKIIISIDNDKYEIQSKYTASDIIGSYFTDQVYELMETRVEFDDGLLANAIIGIGPIVRGSRESRFIVNGVHTLSSNMITVCYESILRQYKQLYPQSSVSVATIKTKLRIIGMSAGWKDLKFTSNDKVKLLTKVRLVKDLSISKELIDTIESTLRVGLMKKLLNGINLKKTKEYRPPSKRTVMLWIVEGESARSGIDIAINRNVSGIYVLRGKTLNADKHESKLDTSNPILILNKILNLLDNKPSTYDKVIIACDPDPDGYHIVGLIVNYLCRYEAIINKIYVLMLPLYKVIGNSKKSEIYYHVMPENQPITSNVKYFKGLGSYSSQEMRHLLKNNDYVYKITDDSSRYYDQFRAFFAKSASIRKEMYNQIDRKPLVLVDNKITFEYLCQMMKRYMVVSLERAIPKIDGCNKTRRKVIFGSYDYKKQTKVNVLGGHITEKTDYAHGDVSLHNVIISMAQTYPCSNWINLMTDEGAFGSRRCKGQDAAKARYLYTCLTKNARQIFNDDYVGVVKMTEDGEPEMYLPRYPLLLINGAVGIGAGFCTLIPPHKPSEVIEYLKSLISKNPIPLPNPMYREYRGFITIKFNDDKEVMTQHGNAKLLVNGMLNITEIPPYHSIEAYIEWLKKNEISFINNSSPNLVDILIQTDCRPDQEIGYWDLLETKTSELVEMILRSLTHDITINCTIIHKDRVLSQTREELFSFWLKSAIYYSKKLQARQIENNENSIDFANCKLWCISQLMLVEFNTINSTEKQLAYLRAKLESEATSNMITAMRCDYRISQLTEKHINQIKMEIDDLLKLKELYMLPVEVSLTNLWESLTVVN